MSAGLLWRLRGVRVERAIAARVARWKSLPEAERSSPPHRGRWVVVDVEASGLNAQKDRLLAIGALGVRDGVVDIADSFETVLRQTSPSSVENIEVHGIGQAEQLSGEPAAEALCAFLEFAGKSPLVAYHAAFDERLLQRAIARHLALDFDRPWLDLAIIAPLAWPGEVAARAGLDGWLERLGIPMAYRHRAIVDCLGTAQLFVALLPRLAPLGIRDAGELLRVSAGSRWLSD